MTKHTDSADIDDEKYPSRFVIEGYIAPSATDNAAEKPSNESNAGSAESDDDVVCMDDIHVGVVEVVDAEAADEPDAKRRKLNA